MGANFLNIRFDCLSLDGTVGIRSILVISDELISDVIFDELPGAFVADDVESQSETGSIKFITKIGTRI